MTRGRYESIGAVNARTTGDEPGAQPNDLIVNIDEPFIGLVRAVTVMSERWVLFASLSTT